MKHLITFKSLKDLKPAKNDAVKSMPTARSSGSVGLFYAGICIYVKLGLRFLRQKLGA